MCIRDSHVAELVNGFKIQVKHPVEPKLADGGQLSGAEVLAQEHAEHRRRLWIFQRHICKMKPRAPRAHADKKLCVSTAVPEGNDDLLAGGLVDSVNSGAYRRFQFPFDTGQKNTV